MKLTHDRLRRIKYFAVGDVAAIIIPRAYATKDANKIPAIIIKVETNNEDNVYTLVYDNYRIKNKYFQHELLKLTGNNDYYDVVINILPEEYIKDMILKFENQELETIPLQTAYNKYIQLIHSDQTDENYGCGELMTDTDNSILAEIQRNENDFKNNSTTMKTMIVNKSNTKQKRLVNVLIRDEMCTVCEESLANTANFIRCYECGQKMHFQDQCQFGMVQYTYRDKRYCSIACHMRQENYEIRIIGEDKVKQKYLIEYKNGHTAYLAAKRVESLAQYAKMVHDWRKQHPIITQNFGDDNDDELEIISSNIQTFEHANSNSNINKGESVCCVCNEEISKDNPHTCYGCKRRMHGHIICPQRHLIFADDDLLYCNECKT